jgi:hypothetical protein
MQMRPPEPTAEISDAARTPDALRTPLGRQELLERLARAARRGLVPGFAERDQAGFRVDADAVPFAYELAGALEDGGAGTIVRLRLRRLRRMPLIFGVVLALTVWPGVWLTDSLMGTYWESYGRWSADMPWLTYAWYLPLTVVPLPWMWRSFSRKSRAEAAESARKQIDAIAAAVEATPM